MEKTLEIHLADQRDAIYEAIINAEVPEPMTWTHKILWEQARIHFARIILEASNETKETTLAE
jgi:hypothetical protein